jgi:hypothetical protein
LAGKILSLEEHEARLLGLNAPTKIAAAIYDEPNRDDELTVAELSRLSADQLQTLYDLMTLARNGAASGDSLNNTTREMPSSIACASLPISHEPSGSTRETGST